MDRKSRLTDPRGPHVIATYAPAQTPTITAIFVGSILAVILLFTPAFAQTDAPPIPENASAKSYGDGWECNIGFRLDENACVAVIVPRNAYDTNRPYGSGWECMHGFRRTDETACVAVEVPEGGFLDPSGERWRCLRGYIKVDDTCQEIVLPANAYLADVSYGSMWTCERGYLASGETCELIEVPENAHLDRSGNRWECDRNFRKSKGQCVLNN
jgi:hypothetical protein